MSAMNNKPCYKCEKRHFLCYADCEDKRRADEVRAVAKAKQRKGAEADALLKSGYQKRKENYRRGGLL